MEAEKSGQTESGQGRNGSEKGKILEKTKGRFFEGGKTGAEVVRGGEKPGVILPPVKRLSLSDKVRGRDINPRSVLVDSEFLSRLCLVSMKTIQRWAKRGMPQVGRNCYRLGAAIDWLREQSAAGRIYD